jgi:hypothetical protein
MTNEFDWRSHSDRYYYYNKDSGKIVGLVSKIALQDIYFGVVYVGEYSFTIQDEKHLGQYISLDHAKKSVELYWDVQFRTLLENK